MKAFLKSVALATAAVALLAQSAAAQLLISGNDEKVSFDPDGKRLVQPPGKDSVSVIDISDRAKPKIIANLPIMNTIVGPPVNLAITPNGRLALVANSLDWVADGQSWKGVPDDKISIIDLTASPPAVIGTVTVGKQPSGMAINRAGTLALVANMADDTVSVLTIEDKTVKVVETVSLAPADTAADAAAPKERPSAVAITPDGKRALVTKFGADTVALLSIAGDRVSYGHYDMATGLSPYNVQITPDGKLGIVNNNGHNGRSDGQIDTVAVIDLEPNPPRVIDQLAVGDGPEGLAINPAGGYAASLILNGSDAPKTAFYHHEHSYVALLRIDGKTVTKVGEAEVGSLAEGIAFSPDGRFLYVGNFRDRNLTILRLQGNKLMQIGALELPGQPASLRGSTP